MELIVEIFLGGLFLLNLLGLPLFVLAVLIEECRS